jgi:transcriptional regulator with XRE-family HTH domain
MQTDYMPPRAHEGRNVKRIREILGIKQEAMAIDLGMSQQAVSQIEQRETIDRDLLEKIAGILHVNPESIKNFTEEQAVYNIQHNHEGSNNTGAINGGNYYCTFNPFYEMLKQIEENKKLYERLIEEKNEMITRLEGLLEKVMNK